MLVNNLLYFTYIKILVLDTIQILFLDFLLTSDIYKEFSIKIPYFLAVK